MTRVTKQFGSGIPVGAPHIELNVYDQTFKVRGKMSGVRLLNVMAALDGSSDKDDASNDVSITRVVLKFLSDALLTEDRGRAMEYFEYSEPPIDLPMLMEIITWLIEQYTGNPTQQPEPSANGSPTNGSGVSESAPSTAVTYVPSTDSNSSPSELSSPAAAQ